MEFSDHKSIFYKEEYISINDIKEMLKKTDEVKINKKVNKGIDFEKIDDYFEEYHTMDTKNKYYIFRVTI